MLLDDLPVREANWHDVLVNKEQITSKRSTIWSSLITVENKRGAPSVAFKNQPSTSALNKHDLLFSRVFQSFNSIGCGMALQMDSR